MVASLISRCKLRLYGYRSYVFDFLDMSRGSSAFTPILSSLPGTHLRCYFLRLLSMGIVAGKESKASDREAGAGWCAGFDGIRSSAEATGGSEEK